MKITENPCIIYKDRKNKKLFNGYTFEILCQLLKQDLGYTKKDILFPKFKMVKNFENIIQNCIKEFKKVIIIF